MLSPPNRLSRTYQSSESVLKQPFGSRNIPHHASAGMATMVGIKSLLTSQNTFGATMPQVLATLIGLLFFFNMLHGCQGTSHIHDSSPATRDDTWQAEHVLPALVICFAKTLWKKRKAPEPDGTGAGDSATSNNSTPASPKKLPRASTASPAVSADGTSTAGALRPREGPAVLSVRPYGLEATSLWRAAPVGHALWQVQITHDVAVPMTKELWRHFNAHLAALHAEDPEAPVNLRDLQDQQCIRLIITRPEPENSVIGYKDWRLAFYIAAPDTREIENFLALWDGFLVYRRRIGRTEGMCDFPMQLHLHRGINVDSSRHHVRRCHHHLRRQTHQHRQEKE